MLSLLCGAVWAAPVQRDIALQVEPKEAVLVVGNSTFTPKNGVYRLPDSLIRGTPTAVLRMDGFGDQPVNLTAILRKEPIAPVNLKPNSLKGYYRLHPGLVIASASLLMGILGLTIWQLRRPSSGRQQESHSQIDYDPPAPTDPLIGNRLGAYSVQSKIGSGGMATVYKAARSDGHTVALKVIRPDQATAEYRQRFEREIQVCMQLSHPNVVQIKDWGQQDDLLYLVMEYVQGKTLDRCIPSDGLGLSEAFPIVSGVTEALAYAHSQGVVHRDLKPENVMICHDGFVKLLDFGLARNQHVHTVTLAGDAVGTPAYMAPEQVLRGPERSGLTDRTDQYALGVLIYEVLCGRRPFEWDDPIKLVAMHLTDEPPSILEFRSDLPSGVEAVLNKMLRKDPEARYGSIKEAGTAFLKAIKDKVPASSRSLAALDAIRSSQASGEISKP